MVYLRDYQRSKVYRAENVLINQPYNTRLNSLEEVQDFLKHLTNSCWFKRRWKLQKQIIVVDGRGRQKASGSSTQLTIWLPLWARTKVVILHELSHVLSGRGVVGVAPETTCPSYHKSYEAGHGREFCKRFLALIKHELGKQAWKDLKESYKSAGVKVRGSDYDWEMQRRKKKEKRFTTKIGGFPHPIRGITKAKEPMMTCHKGRVWDICNVILPDGSKIEGFLDTKWSDYFYFEYQEQWYKGIIETFDATYTMNSYLNTFDLSYGLKGEQNETALGLR